MIKRSAARFLAVAMAASAFGGINAAAASSATAADPVQHMCPDSTPLQSRWIDLPGLKPTMIHSAHVCSRRSGASIKSMVRLYWQIEEDVIQDRSKRYTSFKVTNRLERRSGASGADSVVTTKACDVTNEVNGDYGNSVGLECASPSATFDPAYKWSGDAAIVYDIEGDNKGPITWKLTGSALTS
ncbi:hypothetical protein [Streptomyces sp. NPDC021096]|uniref:hypothetical protein n=1 Tax=Streptomyces sp. NPDC021096 TaxID=3154792 RepID=UPI0033CAAA14